ncbi:hypothetical protein P7K49_005216 [Saguinus oedipus]|uniref:Uncharacterized protein n=1 Tax=Saguinus oedipus TaxID=9490 RepID=A0ABQ9WBA2_SAGOE|nr:hypothetical protein P7K49_005216 [Saguinus oedipus]
MVCAHSHYPSVNLAYQACTWRIHAQHRQGSRPLNTTVYRQSLPQHLEAQPETRELPSFLLSSLDLSSQIMPILPLKPPKPDPPPASSDSVKSFCPQVPELSSWCYQRDCQGLQPVLLQALRLTVQGTAMALLADQ